MQIILYLGLWTQKSSLILMVGKLYCLTSSQGVKRHFRERSHLSKPPGQAAAAPKRHPNNALAPHGHAAAKLCGLELNQVKEMKDNRKSFFNYFSGKGKNRENVAPLLNQEGALVTKNAEMAVIECLICFSLYF